MNQDNILYAFKLEPVGGSAVGIPPEPIPAPFRIYIGGERGHFCCNSAETPEELAKEATRSFTDFFSTCTDLRMAFHLTAVSFKPPYSLVFTEYEEGGGLRACQVKEFTDEELVRFKLESQKTLEEIAESKT